MKLRRRLCSILLLGILVSPSAKALVNLNDGKDLLFVSGTYSIGFDSNVFTRAASKQSFTQSASASIDYNRQAGLIGLTVNVSASLGRFEDVRGQDFADPSIVISLRKRHGRTTGSLSLTGKRESQPDPDVGERTQSWNYRGTLDLRYPVNDRYYLTNNFRLSSRSYIDSSAFVNLLTYSDAIAVNYIYTSKLDLNAAYSIGISDTATHTKAYDHAVTIGAAGSILSKLRGTVSAGVQRRISNSSFAGRETFDSFTSNTSLRWSFSRKLSFSIDLDADNAMTATDLSVNRASAGLHASFALSSKYSGSAGLSYSLSDFLGKAGEGRKDDMLQFDASFGAAITTRLRTSLTYSYSLNYSTLASADFERHSLSLSLLASY